MIVCSIQRNDPTTIRTSSALLDRIKGREVDTNVVEEVRATNRAMTPGSCVQLIQEGFI